MILRRSAAATPVSRSLGLSALALLCLAGATACGASSSNSSASDGLSSETVSTADAPTSDETTTTSTAAEEETTTSETTAPETTTTTAAATEEGLFTDPEGAYTISVSPDWEANHGIVVAEIEVWVVEEPQGGFAPNVNVLTQLTPGIDLQQYLDLSVESAPALSADFELVDSGLIEGANGQPLAMMEYRANSLQYLGIFGITGDGQAVVATLTAPDDRYAELKAEVMPYLLTLQPIPAG